MNEQQMAGTALVASRIADEAIAKFLQAEEAGAPPDRSQFLRDHSTVGSVLESFFDAYDQMEGKTRAGERDAGSFTAGQQLGRHNLVRPIGAGSFGTVWLGFDSQLKRPVAIKVPNQDRFSSRQQRELFLNEAQHVAQLDHPNIVPIYDVGETEAGEIYLVSRFVAGNDLAREMQNRRFSFRETASCIADIANALEYAHGCNLIHRDVKPSNILIDGVTGQPYITDFGLATALKVGDDRLERSSAGTPAYMSPEQAAEEPLDHRSDVFSLGVVLFELLCGSRPFTGANAKAVMNSVREDRPSIPHDLDPQVPDNLQRACLKSLSKPLDDRYGTSGEMESDLRAYLGSQSAERQARSASECALAPSHGYLRSRCGLFLKKPRLVRAVTVVGILTLIVCSWLVIAWPPPTHTASAENSTAALMSLAQPKSIDRQIAEQTIAMGGRVDVRHEGEDYELDSVAAIPAGDISLLWVMFADGQTLDDNFLSRLRLLDSLDGVDLFNCKFSDAGFAMLGEIKSLRYVLAPATEVTDAGAKSLAQLPRLWKLNLKDTNITNETLRQFQRCDTLHQLRVAGTRVNDDGLKFIGTMSNLRELNVSSCHITDAGVKHLSSLRNLHIVKFSRTQVTGESLNYLSLCPLTHLVISSSVSEKAARDFQALHPNCRIQRD